MIRTSRMEELITNNFKSTSNPHLKMLSHAKHLNFVLDILKYQYEKTKRKLTCLDIGGGSAWGDALIKLDFLDYYILDIELNKDTLHRKFLQGDITDSNLQLPLTFDIIFSKDTFEHILNPWDATHNIVKYLNNDGLLIIIVPFVWRYHPVPYDTYRYTHTGLRYLFERLGKIRPLVSGYIQFPGVNGFWKNKKDATTDGKPFPNCQETIYVAQKDDTYIFSKESLDSDFDYKHLT